MPYCWNCDTEATHVYRNHRKERKYLCTTCADAFEVGYCYGQEGGDIPAPIDGWEEDDNVEQSEPDITPEIIANILYHIDQIENGPLFPEYEPAANLKAYLERLGITQLTLPDGRTVALSTEHIHRVNHSIDITTDGDTQSWEAGYELVTE
ncbi:MAG: hypothetical protein K1X50_20605 [Candidatus Promineofilum sp.]|nr:hypothetical protein [Promineifilum sp.]